MMRSHDTDATRKRSSKMKAIVVPFVLLVITALTFVGGYYWDSGQNRGLEFGYFGDFNRVEKALMAVPGVTITYAWANEDVTLEEFGFHFTTPDGQALYLDFQESDPIRQLSGRQLTTALTARVEQKRTPRMPTESDVDR